MTITNRNLRVVFSLLALTFAVTTGSTNAVVLLYQNYTPGTTDYNSSEAYLIDNTGPVYVYDFFAPGQARELSFTFTATTSVIPRHVILPLNVTFPNTANNPSVIVAIAEVNGDGRNWHAAASTPTTVLGDQEVHFAFIDGVTPATRIGFGYVVTISAAYANTYAYLSQVGNDTSNYYTANTTFADTYNIANQSLDTEAAISIHGDLVAAPEPSAVMLLAFGMLAMTWRRSRG